MINARIISQEEFEKWGKFTGATDISKRPYLNYPATGFIVQFLGNTPSDVSYVVIDNRSSLQEAVKEVLDAYAIFIHKNHTPHLDSQKPV